MLSTLINCNQLSNSQANTNRSQTNNSSKNIIKISRSNIMNIDSLCLKSYYFSTSVLLATWNQTPMNLKVINKSLTTYYCTWSQQSKAFILDLNHLSLYNRVIDLSLIRYWIFSCANREFQ